MIEMDRIGKLHIKTRNASLKWCSKITFHDNMQLLEEKKYKGTLQNVDQRVWLIRRWNYSLHFVFYSIWDLKILIWMCKFQILILFMFCWYYLLTINGFTLSFKLVRCFEQVIMNKNPFCYFIFRYLFDCLN